MLEFEILARGLYRLDQLDITYNPSLRMPRTPEIEEWIDMLWQEKLAQAEEQGIPLFDAPLFRLVSAESEASGRLELVLGDTGYKEYVTTREAAFAQRRSHQELGNALSICSVIETSDGYILLDQRQGVDTYVGRYHVIGGFFERERDMDIYPAPFSAISREIREETGISAADIAEQYCLGCVYDLSLPHGELCFCTKLKISLAEVQTRVPEDHEIASLLSLQVTEESLRDFLLTNHGNISPTGEPNLLMYGGMKFGEGWFEEVMRELMNDG